MIRPGDVIPYLQMCQEEGVNLQRGMNFRLRGGFSIILMSLRPNAPYADKILDEGQTLIYEGHDINKTQIGPPPKTVDQPFYTKSGSLTENGKFYNRAKEGSLDPELVKVYEKIRPGIWVFNGLFKLVDSWSESDGKRNVYKFKLELTEFEESPGEEHFKDLDHNRLIPSKIKYEVWKRDKGKCVKCGSENNLHYDHILPYSKGGSSLVVENIQILCARHNLSKSDKIE